MGLCAQAWAHQSGTEPHGSNVTHRTGGGALLAQSLQWWDNGRTRGAAAPVLHLARFCAGENRVVSVFCVVADQIQPGACVCRIAADLDGRWLRDPNDKKKDGS